MDFFSGSASGGSEDFLKINDHQFLELYPQANPPLPLGVMHVCYESSDLEALHAELVAKAAGVTFVTSMIERVIEEVPIIRIQRQRCGPGTGGQRHLADQAAGDPRRSLARG